MKKIGLFIFTLLLFICGGLTVNALTANDVTVDKDNIRFGMFVYANTNNSVLIDNDILNDQTKVYAYVTQLTEAQYNNVKSKLDALNAHIDQCDVQLSELRSQSNELYDAVSVAATAYNDDPTEEKETAYNEARANYQAKVAEYNNLVDACDAESEQKRSEYYQTVEINESNFTEISRNPDSSTTASKEYEYYYGNYAYGVVLVKVVNGSNSVYNFGLVTADIDDDTTIGNNTENNTENNAENNTENNAENNTNNNATNNTVQNPNTGLYYGTGILVAIAFVGVLSYALLRRKSRFSRSC